MKAKCFQCQFFKVTWDPQNPRACVAYGFKTKQIPSVVVKQSSGTECLKFVSKVESRRMQ
ncbi:uracil-DNA glycosylase [Lysinibacillus fusiformis]|uniref:uracil-DNA glycosylase n=1 Tax=Lysinibacillus fusiformis TaxID=28031 RepID=UPI00215B1CC5|nr:uracil-DNA glycosylase [Lysinibacillus fusiformis]MCR8854573.1 uracil-DNA glycosylase [Lysinibacillus fusiformis]